MSDTHAPAHRRYELDWIRVIAFSLLILFHTGMFFNTWDWHVKNNVTVTWLEPIMEFLHQWRMPILFFVSGAAVWFMMDKYPTGRFVWERHNRLLLPLAVGMFFIIPPQVYYERLFQGQTFDFVTFYRTVLDLVPYPKGNFSWHHLWYIPYIFTFSMVALPLFLFFKGQRGRRVLAAFQSFVAKGNRIYFLFLPVAVSEICIRPFWPDN
ncbi:MAG: acyltransferase family protein, partial [Bacteroidetes bacterium]|nr:acyltransferase family protein [Bacteroidota bacterium]